jgi:Asp-tRNA(Asn)/Glu-tRNA(Gln) amidotransferase C subunit
MDPDEPGQMLPPATLLKMAPATDGPFIAVPKVLGESEGGGGA